MDVISRWGELAYRAFKNPNRAFEYANYKFQRELLSKRKAKRLSSLEDSTVRRLGIAIQDVVSNELDSEEKGWIVTLENMRETIDSDTDTITMIDYGAGSPDADRETEEMETGVQISVQINELAKSNYSDCLLLFKIIRETKPNQVLEMGTSVGMSTAYQAAALHLNERGELTTIEGSKSVASVAKNYTNSIDLSNFNIKVGRFQDELPVVLENTEQFDMVFVDGHHDGDATLQYFDLIYPHLSADAVLIFDDIHWDEDMNEAWQTIKTDERTSTTIDVGRMGICTINDGMGEFYSIPI